MRSFANPLLAVLVAGSLAACSSTPTQQQTSGTETLPQQHQQPVETQPVETPSRLEPETNGMPLTADNFYNNPANYSGTTDTRVIYFAFDSDAVPPAAYETLRAHAAYLKSHPNAKVRLEGNADERGTREYNVALSERRAKSVRQFLRVQGVPASQLVVVGYGEEKPAAFGHTPMDWAKNRRVVINYLVGSP